MSKPTLFIFLLFLASCTNSNSNYSNTNAVDTANTVMVKPAPAIKVIQSVFDFAKLYNKSWVPVSMHYHDTTNILIGYDMHLQGVFKNNGDSSLNGFLPDTAEYKKFFEQYVDFGKDGQWRDFEGDIGSAGSFTIDSAHNIISTDVFPFGRNYSKDKDLVKVNVKYLDNKYLLLQSGREIYFYVNAAKMPKWRFVGGG